MEQRHVLLDYYKILLSIFVVIIHIPFFKETPTCQGLMNDNIARIAVPSFFIINGYFLFTVLEKGHFFKYIKRSILLYIFWMVVYLPFYFSDLNIKKIVVTLFFGWHHLWYIIAWIVSSIIITIIYKSKFNTKVCFIISLSFIFLGYFLQFTDIHNFHFYRNALSCSFPFILIGYLINKNKILQKRFKYIDLLILFSLTVFILESFFLKEYFNLHHKFIKHIDITLSSLILSPLLFYWIMNKKTKNLKLTPFISKLSAGIYFIHVLFIYLGRYLGLTEFSLLFFVLITSFISSYFLFLINKKLKFIL
ncbi:acyltransferase family protein [Dysgonomonas sp. 511]|uniref:acyltransferase family protein n=1 Tax=Dysgonomonas sp. 511 TaxID=2302930 RepID=UPI0013D624D6|nr:hypothetical protein [Dysgonomonas sp. 511]